MTNYKTWQEFFQQTFAETGKYICSKEETRNSVVTESFTAIDKNDETEINVGYMDDALLHLHYIHPKTKGFTKYQELVYFYQYDFTPGKSYGYPGLEFNEINIQGIDKELREGQSGKEVQFYKDGNLVKSKLYFNGMDNYGIPVNFEDKGVFKRLIDLLSGKNKRKNFTLVEIDLKTIFKGV